MVTLDTLLLVDALPSADEALVGVREVAVSLGGKGVIPALTLKSLGINTGLLCLTSDTSADVLVNQALRRHFGDEFLLPALDRVNATWILVAEDGRTHTAVRVGNYCERKFTNLHEVVRSFIASFPSIYVGAEVPALLAAVLSECKDYTPDIVVNPSNALMRSLSNNVDIFAELLRRSCCLLMNEAEEAEALAVLKLSGWAKLKSGRLKCVVVTTGRRGGRFSESPFDTWHAFAAVPTSPLCPVGAGDVFAGAFVRHWLLGAEKPRLACEKAAAAASEKVRNIVTGMRIG